jgi:hypothetical protein
MTGWVLKRIYCSRLNLMRRVVGSGANGSLVKHFPRQTRSNHGSAGTEISITEAIMGFYRDRVLFDDRLKKVCPYERLPKTF